METMIYVFLVLALAGDAFLLFKYLGVRRGIGEITAQLRDKTESDTNTLIYVKGGDRFTRKLAEILNRQLRIFREEEHRFKKGDNEVKEAVANISHDLRTPITAISGYLELLEREEKNEKVERYIGIISERCGALKSLTEDLFEYSVIASKADNLKLKNTCLNEELEVALASFYGALTEAGIEPDISMPEKKIIRQLDSSMLQRVFGNIINNALKYSDGDLTVRLEENGTIVFANSAGDLTPVDTARLFERFYTVQTARGSTGLGLSIARMLTGKMNGSIHAEYNNGMLEIFLSF